MTALSGKARLAGVMGWPVEHSRSPRLHGFWLATYAVDGAYVPLPVRPERIGEALRALAVLSFAGANLTLPHKEAALAHLDERTAVARRIGAVNTIVVGPDGRLRGDNTDGFGFLAHLRASVPAWSAGERPVAVLGAGGAARAVIVALQDAGAREVRLTNRTVERAEELRRVFGAAIKPVPWAEREEALAGASLVVNTTSLGMVGKPPLELRLDRLAADAVVYDLVYAPLETALLRGAAARHNRTVDGLGMLLHQARPGFAAWFGVEPEVTPALRAHMLADLLT
jgi:shikimate dehydrogenase